jgi:hypothetical protein
MYIERESWLHLQVATCNLKRQLCKSCRKGVIWDKSSQIRPLSAVPPEVAGCLTLTDVSWEAFERCLPRWEVPCLWRGVLAVHRGLRCEAACQLAGRSGNVTG